MTFSENTEGNLSFKALEEALAEIDSPAYKDIPIRFEMSRKAERVLRNKLDKFIPPTVLGVYAGIPVYIDPYLPDNVIRFVYEGRTVAKIISIGGYNEIMHSL